MSCPDPNFRSNKYKFKTTIVHLDQLISALKLLTMNDFRICPLDSTQKPSGEQFPDPSRF